MHVAFMNTPNGLAIMVEGKSLTVASDHPNFSEIQQALREKRYSDLPGLMDLPTKMAEWIGDRDGFTMVDGIISLNGDAFTEDVSQKVLDMIKAGLPPEPLLNFLRKVRENPAYHAQTELLLFCAANGFMIHEDGDIIAYKAVREDYTSVHQNAEGVHLDNSVGAIVTEPRHKVDDCRENTCSRGLHFAALEYARGFTGGPRMVVLKIHPKDVVSIPTDYNNQKGRCCRYEVIAELADRYNGLPKQEVYSNGDIAAAAQGSLRTKTHDRVLQVLGRLAGKSPEDIRASDSLGYLGIDTSGNDVENAIEHEFAEGITAATVFYSGTTVSDIVEDVLSELALCASDDDEDDEDLDDDTFDDVSDIEDDFPDDDDETRLDQLMKSLQARIISRDIESSHRFRQAIEYAEYDPSSEEVREAAARANLSQWL